MLNVKSVFLSMVIAVFVVVVGSSCAEDKGQPEQQQSGMEGMEGMEGMK